MRSWFANSLPSRTRHFAHHLAARDFPAAHVRSHLISFGTAFAFASMVVHGVENDLVCLPKSLIDDDYALFGSRFCLLRCLSVFGVAGVLIEDVLRHASSSVAGACSRAGCSRCSLAWPSTSVGASASLPALLSASFAAPAPDLPELRCTLPCAFRLLSPLPSPALKLCCAALT